MQAESRIYTYIHIYSVYEWRMLDGNHRVNSDTRIYFNSSECANVAWLLVCLLLMRRFCLMEEHRLRASDGDVRSIFGPKRDEVKSEWRKPRSEEQNELYSSPYIVLVIKLRRRYLGRKHVWRRGEEYTGFWWGNLRERTTWETQT